ncbi:unnamed protein product [Soboliphyme baturini]|uniref:RNA helicase n=1 Tax=Soboliphyme baturini TaxID=241478 RepID=A0A183ICZ3_9BILA|nr:unnamed protein product [Soboliphyme baturini]
MGKDRRDYSRRSSRERSPKDKERDRRRRSRSPRDRGLERSRDRRSPKDKRREKDKDRSQKSTKNRSHSQSPMPEAPRVGSIAADLVNIFDINNKEAEKKLEEEMRKRKERIERWRAERRARMIASGQIDVVAESKSMQPSKKWTLEDDADDEMEPDDMTEAVVTEAPKTPPEKPAKTVEEPMPEAAENPDEDPLDAYMQEVHQEVHQLRSIKETMRTQNEKTQEIGKAKIVVVTKIATHKDPSSKGDIIEQDADALEYSDEEDDIDIEQAMSSLAARAKQLPVTDHGKVYYRPFRKNFYIEVPELAKMTNEEVEAYREELEGIRVRGKNCPKPIKNWAQSGSSRKVLDVLKKSGFEKPTPIQAQAIPAILCGRDVIGIAKTGSGKTLAFLIPMYRHVLDQPSLEEMDGPIALIMTPTRELAMQIAKQCRKFTRALGLNTVCVYGGTGISEQIAELKRGAEIIVCTPGRMIDMLAANNGKVTNLRRVTYLVLDEADRMFDMGFEPQVMKIVGNIRPDRQTVMFSATFPRQMEALARKVLQKPIEIIVGSRSVVCKEVEQHVCIVDDDQKFLKLLELLGVYYELGNILVFVDKQEKADELVGDLIKAGYPAAPIHGGLDQFDRDSTIVDFRSGVIRLLIATSVAARGLDVKNMILVVNYDCPNHYEDYVHRVGRTGRAGNKGYAYTFITPTGQERNSGDLVKALELSGSEVPDELMSMWEVYKKKMAAEGKEVKQGGGYGGHGYKFDEAEAEAVASKRKMEKLVLGLQGSDDDDDDDIEQQIQSLMKSTRRVTEGALPLFMSNGTVTAAGVAQANQQALERAKALAKQINIERNLGLGAKDIAQQTAEAVLKGGAAGPVSVSAKTIAQQLAEKLNEKLNYVPSELPPQEEQQEYSRYEEELEINDFPQQVRWRITSRETLSQVQEYAEVGISLAISRAKSEIIRVLKEEIRKLASMNSAQIYNKAKYKVL